MEIVIREFFRKIWEYKKTLTIGLISGLLVLFNLYNLIIGLIYYDDTCLETKWSLNLASWILLGTSINLLLICGTLCASYLSHNKLFDQLEKIFWIVVIIYSGIQFIFGSVLISESEECIVNVIWVNSIILCVIQYLIVPSFMYIMCPFLSAYSIWKSFIIDENFIDTEVI